MKNSSFLHPSFLLLKSFCFRSNIKHSTRSSSKILGCPSYFQLSSQCFIWWWNPASNHHFLNLRGEYWGTPPPLHTHKKTHTTITTRKKIDHSCSKALLSPGVRAVAIRSWRKRNGKQKTKAFKTREFPNSTLFISEYGIITGLLKTVEFTLLSYRNPDFRLGPGSVVGEKRQKNRPEPKKSASEATWTASVSLRFLPFSPPSPVPGYLDLKACERWYFSFCLGESSQYSFPREHDGVFPCLSFILAPVCTYSHLRAVLKFSVLRFLVIDSSPFSVVNGLYHWSVFPLINALFTRKESCLPIQGRIQDFLRRGCTTTYKEWSNWLVA